MAERTGLEPAFHVPPCFSMLINQALTPLIEHDKARWSINLGQKTWPRLSRQQLLVLLVEAVHQFIHALPVGV